jgi:hypothetical protein
MTPATSTTLIIVARADGTIEVTRGDFVLTEENLTSRWADRLHKRYVDQPHLVFGNRLRTIAPIRVGALCDSHPARRPPPAARLAVETRAQCAASVPDGHDGNVELSANWDPPEKFQKGTDIYGACFISFRTGDPLPPRD